MAYLVFILVSGILKQKTDPSPGSELNHISPPSNSTYAFAIGNPSPVPSDRIVLLLSTW